MKLQPLLSLIGIPLAASIAFAAEATAPAPADDAGIEVQTRGPIHEAYAQPATGTPQPGPIISKRPPEAVPEVPPDQKPEGDNVVWIPGYWSWDVDRNDFLWVSGIWRAAPPNRTWVPGHWAEAQGGWQWVPGFWADSQQQELQYLPAPPDSIDYGPSAPQPDVNSVYIPGLWVYRVNRFWWRPGYWWGCQPDWLWVPSRYVWTPTGYVCVNGYWDYPLDRRGCLFAPVYFHRNYWQNPGWTYTPSYYVGVSSLLGSLFVRPHCSSYYFGDYYDSGYARLGFRPWFSFGARHYDPLYGYYGWRHRDDPAWASGLRSEFFARRNGELARPPRSFAAQNAFVQSNAAADPGLLSAVQVARPYSRFGSDVAQTQRLSPTQVQQAVASASSFADLRQRRNQLERFQPAASAGGALPAATLPLNHSGRNGGHPGIVAAPPSQFNSPIQTAPAASLSRGRSSLGAPVATGIPRHVTQFGPSSSPSVVPQGPAAPLPRINHGQGFSNQPAPSIRHLPPVNGAPAMPNISRPVAPPVRSSPIAPHASSAPLPRIYNGPSSQPAHSVQHMAPPVSRPAPAMPSFSRPVAPPVQHVAPPIQHSAPPPAMRAAAPSHAPSSRPSSGGNGGNRRH